jgi:hypothetical protein
MEFEGYKACGSLDAVHCRMCVRKGVRWTKEIGERVWTVGKIVMN